MERRHFEVIAEVIASLPLYAYPRQAIARVFADRLCQTNPNFNRERFMKACGVS